MLKEESAQLYEKLLHVDYTMSIGSGFLSDLDKTE